MYVKLCVSAIPTPCLLAFWHFIPTSFSKLLEIFFLDFIYLLYIPSSEDSFPSITKILLGRSDPVRFLAGS